MEFYKSGMGSRFFNHQFPGLTRAIEDLTKEVKRLNDLKEKELGVYEEVENDGAN